MARVTVDELIEDLRRTPSRWVPVVIAVKDRGAIVYRPCRARFDGNRVVIEED
jgi:hypothetical protein